LSLFNLQAYVLTSPRTTNLISSNKEGLVSLIGYLSIHILGLSTGTLVLPYSPSFFRRHQKAISGGNKPPSPDLPQTRYRQTDKTTVELISYTVVWWVLLGVVKVLQVGGEWYDAQGGGVSRRLVRCLKP
jgi:phosphatidylinositol glycan class W